MGVVQSRHGSGTFIACRAAFARDGGAELSRRAPRIHPRRDVRGAPHPRSGSGGPRRRARDPGSDRDAGRGSGRHVRVDGGSADVPRPRHQLPSSGGGGIAAIRSSPRWSRWCPRCTTKAGATPRRGPAIATCATRRRCTAGSIRRSGRNDALAAREAMQTHLVQASAHQAQEGSDAEVPPAQAASGRARVKRRRAAS